MARKLTQKFFVWLQKPQLSVKADKGMFTLLFAKMIDILS